MELTKLEAYDYKVNQTETGPKLLTEYIKFASYPHMPLSNDIQTPCTVLQILKDMENGVYTRNNKASIKFR